MSSPCPRLRDLDSALSSLSWGEVKRMAIHLHHSLTLPALDKIGEDRSTAGERCLYCMKQWLDGDVDACWAKVVTALREIGKNQLAKELQSRYCAGCPVSRPKHTSDAPTYSEPRTQPLALHVSPVIGTASNAEDIPSPSVDVFTCKFTSDLDELERVVKGFLNLEEQFVSLVTHVQFYFSEKESESPKFLGMFRLTLINLPMSRKFKHMHFLGEKNELITAAQNVSDIFNILRPYWDHVDYSLLEHITMEFGSRGIKKKVKFYISSLTQFEKETTIQIFVNATCDDRKIPPEFSEVIIKLDRRPSECTLYDIRKFKESLACRSSLNAYCVQLKRVGVGSVVMVLAIHRDVVDMFVKAAEDFQFKIGSKILSVERVATAVESKSVASVLQTFGTAKPSGSDAQYIKLSGDHVSYQEMFHSSERPDLHHQLGIPYGSPLNSPTLEEPDSPAVDISCPPSPVVSSFDSENEEEPLRDIAELISVTTPADQQDRQEMRASYRYSPCRPSQTSSFGIHNLFESPMCGPDHLRLERHEHDATTAESPGATVQPQSRLAELKNQIMMGSSASKLSLLSSDSGFSSSYSLSSYLSSSTLSIFSNVSSDSQSSVHHSDRSDQLPKYRQRSRYPLSSVLPVPEVSTPGEGETALIDKILLEAVGCLMHQENCRIPQCPCKQVKRRFQHILPQTREHMQEEADKIIEEAQSGNFDPTDRRQQMRLSLSSQNFNKDIHGHYHMTSRSHIRQSRGSQRFIRRRSKSMDLTPVIEQPESCATTPGVIIPDSIFSPAITRRSKSIDLTPVIEQPECREALHVLSPTMPSTASIAPPVLLREISLSANNLPSLCLNDCPMAATPLMQLANRPLGSTSRSPLSMTQHRWSNEPTVKPTQPEEIPDRHKDSPSSNKGHTSNRFTSQDSTSSLRTTSTHSSALPHSSRVSHLSTASTGSHISQGSDGSITAETLC